MTLEKIQSVIQENIPDILSIGEYPERIKKCVELLKITHFPNDYLYILQESDDVVKMLDMFVTEDKSWGYLKDYNYEAFNEAIQIINLCKSCTYENKYWREIPLLYTCQAKYGFKTSILGIEIGNKIDDVIQTLDRYKIIFELNKGKDIINVENKIVDGETSFKLQILIENDCVSSFILNSNLSGKKWLTLAVVENFFAECNYKLEKCSNENIKQIYNSYYDIAEVDYNFTYVGIRIISSKQYNEKHKKWWKP